MPQHQLNSTLDSLVLKIAMSDNVTCSTMMPSAEIRLIGKKDEERDANNGMLQMH